MSIRITCWSDLSQFGIFSLTGEACAYSMRLLCDLSEEGREHMSNFFGLPLNTEFSNPWNHMTGERKHVASVLLAYEILKPLAKFILLSKGAHTVCYNAKSRYGEGANGYFGEDGTEEAEQDIWHIDDACNNPDWEVHVNVKTDQPQVGDRNVHAMSSRVR